MGQLTCAGYALLATSDFGLGWAGEPAEVFTASGGLVPLGIAVAVVAGLSALWSP